MKKLIVHSLPLALLLGACTLSATEYRPEVQKPTEQEEQNLREHFERESDESCDRKKRELSRRYLDCFQQKENPDCSEVLKQGMDSILKMDLYQTLFMNNLKRASIESSGEQDPEAYVEECKYRDKQFEKATLVMRKAKILRSLHSTARIIWATNMAKNETSGDQK